MSQPPNWGISRSGGSNSRLPFFLMVFLSEGVPKRVPPDPSTYPVSPGNITSPDAALLDTGAVGAGIAGAGVAGAGAGAAVGVAAGTAVGAAADTAAGAAPDGAGAGAAPDGQARGVSLTL